jgi:hypothetical protein
MRFKAILATLINAYVLSFRKGLLKFLHLLQQTCLELCIKGL